MKTHGDFALEEALERGLMRRLTSLVSDYALEDKPTLVWQCLPAFAAEVDVSAPALKAALREGAAAVSSAAWWCAFHSHHRPTPVFDGVSSGSSSEGWVSEVHRDGHFVAATWSFPDISSGTGGSRPAIAEFYVEAFRDFVYTAAAVLKAASLSGPVYFTCTMLHADMLPMTGRGGGVNTAAPKRKTLRWPTLLAADEGDFDKVRIALSAQFLRAYGKDVLRT